MDKRIFTIGVLTLFITAGCSSSPYAVPQPPGPGFGDSQAQNLNLQILDPKPDLAGKEVPALDGRRDALAMDRYQTGKTIKPIALKTSTIGAGGAMEPQQ